MIYAVKHNKVNRGIYKANEDALTSTIFERLMYLPKELMHHIIYTSLMVNIEGLELHQIESITYWPTWNAKGIKNKSTVEPDVFIRTTKQDIGSDLKFSVVSEFQILHGLQSNGMEYALFEFVSKEIYF